MFTKRNHEKKCNCLSVILIDSIFRTGKNYYPEVFSEELKYIVKENKILDHVTEKI